MDYQFKAKIWIWEGPGPWYFITVPKNVSSEIREKFRMFHRGWGSIPVEVLIGSSRWSTSIFWEKKGTYLLPIKKAVRDKEEVTNGDSVKVNLLIKLNI
jgi:hypothetical protein